MSSFWAISGIGKWPILGENSGTTREMEVNQQLIGAMIGIVGLAMILAPKIVGDVGSSWSKAMGSEPNEEHPVSSLIVIRLLGVPMLFAAALLINEG